ncbi:PEP-CTERM sorting domain-containing protein [Colwellia psychrerythraea]|uniref:Ice-binding protein C-terminal domain-containing protein n=1 Tax=Colwellia psychrerythraea (strain 34H / ATCC BAA-681) TaxID=167879 RepID=Q489X3_COLP3|nr:PEP-CTERM sorting domain-containing protein [Colwellia psychrerythraea]AAZ24265.1 hypothetical protein CPS_0383 [Colwellia psychrerythraea 34H]
MKFKFLNIALACLFLCVTSTSNAGLIFDITEYTDSKMAFSVTGTLDQAYNSNRHDSLFYVGTDFSLSQMWNSSNMVFTGNSTVQGNSVTWDRANNGSTTGYALFGWANSLNTILAAGTVINFDVTAVGTFNSIDYAPSDFELYIGTNTIRHAHHKIADAVDSTNKVPEPSTLAIFALGMIGFASRRFKNNLNLFSFVVNYRKHQL